MIECINISFFFLVYVEDVAAVHGALGIIPQPLAQALFMKDMTAVDDLQQMIVFLPIKLGQTDGAIHVLDGLAIYYFFKASFFVLIDEILLPAHESLSGNEEEPRWNTPDEGVHINEEVEVEIGKFQFFKAFGIMIVLIVAASADHLNHQLAYVHTRGRNEEADEDDEDDVIDLLNLEHNNQCYEEDPVHSEKEGKSKLRCLIIFTLRPAEQDDDQGHTDQKQQIYYYSQYQSPAHLQLQSQKAIIIYFVRLLLHARRFVHVFQSTQYDY